MLRFILRRVGLLIATMIVLSMVLFGGLGAVLRRRQDT